MQAEIDIYEECFNRIQDIKKNSTIDEVKKNNDTVKKGSVSWSTVVSKIGNNNMSSSVPKTKKWSDECEDVDFENIVKTGNLTILKSNVSRIDDKYMLMKYAIQFEQEDIMNWVEKNIIDTRPAHKTKIDTLNDLKYFMLTTSIEESTDVVLLKKGNRYFSRHHANMAVRKNDCDVLEWLFNHRDDEYKETSLCTPRGIMNAFNNNSYDAIMWLFKHTIIDDLNTGFMNNLIKWAACHEEMSFLQDIYKKGFHTSFNQFNISHYSEEVQEMLSKNEHTISYKK